MIRTHELTMRSRAVVVLVSVAVLACMTRTARAQPGVPPPAESMPPTESVPPTAESAPPTESVPPPEAVPPPATSVQPPAAQPPAAPLPLTPRRTKRYGLAVAGMDGLAVGLAGVGALVALRGSCFDSEACGDGEPGLMAIGVVMVFGGVGTYIAGGPYIHHRHHNSTGGLTSLGLRLLPLVALWLAPPLAAVAFVAAPVIDWFVLAKVKVGGKPQVYAAPLAGGGASLGVAGAF